jgi:hypothetical protein
MRGATDFARTPAGFTFRAARNIRTDLLVRPAAILAAGDALIA